MPLNRSFSDPADRDMRPPTSREAAEEFVGAMASQGKETAHNLLADSYKSVKENLVAPAFNAALLEPYNTAANGINAVSSMVGGNDLVARQGRMTVAHADFLSTGWLVQGVAGGLGALVPYVLAGKAAGSMMRGAGASLELSGTAARLAQNERMASVLGATAYDLVRDKREGETHLANGAAGAASFSIFEAGNAVAGHFGLPGKLLVRTATGLIGGGVQALTSEAVANKRLVGKEELVQAAIGGMVMGHALPASQRLLGRAVDQVNLGLGRGIPLDRAVGEYFPEGRQSSVLNDLVNKNPWARVQMNAPDSLAQGRRVELAAGAKAPELGHELEHLGQNKNPQFETGFARARELLASGQKEEAWQAYRETRLAQEEASRNIEGQIRAQLGSSTSKFTDIGKFTEFEKSTDIGKFSGGDKSTESQKSTDIARQKVGDRTYEEHWAREFALFVGSGGAFRPVTNFHWGPEPGTGDIHGDNYGHGHDHNGKPDGANQAKGNQAEEAAANSQRDRAIEKAPEQAVAGGVKPDRVLTDAEKRELDLHLDKIEAGRRDEMQRQWLESNYQKEIATELVRVLQNKKHIAVFAGGAVRDEVMGKIPKDYDIATSARPEEVERIFQDLGLRVIPVGKAFGVINVVVDGREFEIATLRTDGNYVDGRRPQSVQFVGSLAEDASRRDLTMNAMFKDPISGQVYDFFGGKDDIASGIIRAVGNASDRFADDKLRMLRIPRFASRYGGFSVDPDTMAAIKANSVGILNVSGERIRDEIKGTLTGQEPVRGMQIMMNSGLMRHILPEVYRLRGPKGRQDPEHHPEGTVWTHTKLVLNNLKGGSFERMMGGLLHDVGKPDTQKFWPDGGISNHGHDSRGAEITHEIAKRFKLSGQQENQIVDLVRLHMLMHEVQKLRPGKLAALLERGDVMDLIELQHADANGTTSFRPERSQKEFLLGKLEDMQNKGQLGQKPIVDGRLLLDFNLKPGPAFRVILDAARDAQHEGEFSDADGARRWLKENMDKLVESEQSRRQTEHK